MLQELSEREVRGELAAIYEEIRVYSAVPYVSSLQRHLATMPGCLEFAWHACRPAFVSGRLQHIAWQLAGADASASLPEISPAALQLLGVDEGGLAQIRNIYANFVRVAPVNLLFAGVLQRLLEGGEPGNQVLPGLVPPLPAMLPPMPELVPHDQLEESVVQVLMQLATVLGGQPFVPGLYRLLVAWPAYLAHVATLVEPELKSTVQRERRRLVAGRIVDAADEILRGLPPLRALYAPPDPQTASAVISAIMTYRITSPEMIVFGSLLQNTLPEVSNLD